MPAARRDVAEGCRSCGSDDVAPFYTARGIPVHSCLVMPDQQSALDYRTGDLELSFCVTCGFVQNARFDPGVHEYSPRYEETQSFSPRFNRFAAELARDLIGRWDLRGKTILEIGCGKGEFLCLICELGDCAGIGFDPGYRPERTGAGPQGRVRFVQDFWSERYAADAADLVCCRHTLEHIPDVAAFVRSVRRAIGDRTDTLVFFEVPDVRRVLEENAFWDVYYEHCSYFTLGSLARLFRANGFDVLDLATGFDDQYLLLVARPGRGTSARPELEADLDATARAVAAFRDGAPRALDAWRAKLDALRRRGQRAVLWGSGSKAVAFLTTLGADHAIEFAVDINPHKQGTFLAGTGQRIVAPEFLAELRPDLVIAMNPIYLDEIRSECAKLGVDAELVAL